MVGELDFLVVVLLPATGVDEGNIFPDIWLEGRLDADDDVDDKGIFEIGEGTTDPEVVVECLGL